MKNLTTIALIVVTPISVFAFNKTTCTMNKSERIVEVTYTDSAKKTPCEVNYSKEDGTSKVLWNSERDANYCETKASEFVQKLHSIGWKCSETPAIAPLRE